MQPARTARPALGYQRTWTGLRCVAAGLAIGLAILVAPAFAAVPEPNAVIFGFGGVPLSIGTVVEGRVGTEVVATYTVGAIPAAGNSYILQAPVETPTTVGEARAPGTARIGDLITLHVNGTATGLGTTLVERGQVTQLNLNTSSDILAPSTPTVISTSHTVGTWSTDPTVDISWSGSSDAQSGMAGYSVLDDILPATLPDATVDRPHLVDPHTLTIGPLPDAAARYFHLRACDTLGNCTPGGVHLGPFKIDATPPSAPSFVVRNGPAGGSTLEMSWVAATDAVSGVAGYGWKFTRTAGGTCTQVSKGLATTATSDPLTDGNWYFYVCAADAASNWGPLASAVGPFSVELEEPTVKAVGSVGAGDGKINHLESVEVPITQLIFAFSEAMSDPGGHGGASDVTNPANYLLVEGGGDGIVQTVDCTTGTTSDDVEIVVESVVYDQAEDKAYLRLPGVAGLPAGRYRLSACAALRDLAAKELDGNANGIGGDDFVRDFAVRWTNLLANPNFDDGVGDWTYDGNPSAGLFEGVDMNAALTSGSAEIAGSSGVGELWLTSQCVQVVPNTSYNLLAHAEVASSSGDPTALVVVGLFADTNCATPLTSSPEVFSETIAEDTAGQFEQLGPRSVNVRGAQSAKVSLAVSTAAAASFEVRFDTVALHATVGLFVDGFDDGNTSQWIPEGP